ncbi:Tetratricopeptide-like helical [Phytophthora cinnamomi]|uniref:Tetratricopeptide-like helical n=1 Tax=Phytophthora cinnamomi TaxID=4785 RepID=UPI0035594CF3|nr:Tetratricopeptide-like helical [Phytophthora cinnamomi]
MESAWALLQLVRDAAAGAHSANLSESDLVRRLESVRNQLQRVGSAEIRPESAAVAVCHVTSQVVEYLVHRRPIPASVKWHKHVILLETAVASAVTAIASSGGAVEGELEVEIPDRWDISSSFTWLLQKLWRTSQTPQQAANAVAIMAKLCVLLSCCWLRYDRVGTLSKVEKLLKGCSDFCLKHEQVEMLAKWPLFLLGMVAMVERKEYQKALQCFRGVVDKCGEEDGVFFYWYAVALIQCGLSSEAGAALDKCIRANYEPRACLSLQALVNLQARDFHAAAEQLQRALEIDFSQASSFFNYALLMERMQNFEAQQQLLEYALESCTGAGERKQPRGIVAVSNVADSAAALFDKTALMPLFPSKLTSMSSSKIHFHLAVAAMENGNWLESKKHFEKFLRQGELTQPTVLVAEAARDYVYVLLQCKLPSLALSTCAHYLLKCGESHKEDVAMVSVLLLHLYKADALLCLERVDECYEYLKRIVEPKIQEQVHQPKLADVSDTISDEIAACHVQLVNNLAVVMACRSGADSAISILRDGLQQYPESLAIKFNLVLLLWRRDDKLTACSVWAKARGWDLQSGAPIGVNHVGSTFSNGNRAASSISEHVHDDVGGEEGVTTQQLKYLDTLVSIHLRKTRDSNLEDRSLQYVEYLESLGTTEIPSRD